MKSASSEAEWGSSRINSRGRLLYSPGVVQAASSSRERLSIHDEIDGVVFLSAGCGSDVSIADAPAYCARPSVFIANRIYRSSKQALAAGPTYGQLKQLVGIGQLHWKIAPAALSNHLSWSSREIPVGEI